MQLVEVGPRDGLQSEPTVLPTETKIELIRRLLDAGLRRIEVASFVHPRLVPQLADAEAVVVGLPNVPEASYIGLVLNRRGLDRALATGVHEINFVAYASAGYAHHNANASVDETMASIEAMVPEARAAGKRTTVTISVAWGDPFDGVVPPAEVVALARRAAATAIDEIALADTIGAAVPATVRSLLAEVRSAVATPIRCHFHNTRNTGYANALAAAEEGIAAVDTAVGGYGGSPFAPAAGGNVATEDMAHMLAASGADAGLSISDLVETASWLAERLASPTPAMLGRAGVFPQ